ncbi:hypothetical protein BKA67DRAFT_570924 [Truncatella angustata]|uniref:Uncharacterized protein n=1 Tax=Truncatella angustata TaxID=152316 RepID=A0A9P8UFU3_9PEZI|nr:uncharacterized protein BKA67DRAFT_570924 [Truncatella angustata]KAH6651429.1 hypothetical protein BKA67DRAFT_570924 [Truncatella angustata]
MPSSALPANAEGGALPGPPKEHAPGFSDDPKRPMTGFRWFLFVTSTLIAIFVYSLNNTIVANLIPVSTGPLALRRRYMLIIIFFLLTNHRQ